jgi:hypothetical protein
MRARRPMDQRFLLEPLRDELGLRGTFAPFFRASLRPIAIACLRLFTRPPDPLFSVPFFRRRIADSTLFEADLPYFAMWRPPGGQVCKARADRLGEGSTGFYGVLQGSAGSKGSTGFAVANEPCGTW